MVLLIGWVMFLRATWNSLGPIGTILAGAFFGVIVWLLVHWGIISLTEGSTFQWVVLLALVRRARDRHVLVARKRRRLSGQYDTDEIEG